MLPETETLETGCVRQKTAGRGAYELLSPFVLQRDAELYEWGADHRGHRNWEKGMPFGRCIQSIFRHLMKYLIGESDEDHDDNLAAIRFWTAALMHYEEMIKRGLLPHSLNDLPTYLKVGVPRGVDTKCPLRIYVAGPITASSPQQLAANYKTGQVCGQQLEAKGHVVFVPHRYEIPFKKGKQGLGTPEYETYLRLDLSLIEQWATALYFIAPSPGANRERRLAEKLGLPIYELLAEVPDLLAGKVQRGQISEEEFKAFCDSPQAAPGNSRVSCRTCEAAGVVCKCP